MKLINIINNKFRLDRAFNVNPTQAIVLGFASLILLGTVLLSLPIVSRDGTSIGFINALFTATSAVCVTGLVVVDTYTYWNTLGQIIILLLIQMGGLGFMTMATLFSFVLRRRISLKERLIITESLNQYSLQGIVKLTQHILIGTLIFEGIGALLLSIRFIPEFGVKSGIFNAIFHAISAFCNAGFDLMGQHEEFSSLTRYVGDPFINIVIMSLIVIGGLGFAVWDDIYKTRRFNELYLHTKLVVYITIILILSGFVLILAIEYNNPYTLGHLDIKGKFLAAMFQSVTPRTAGFNTVNLNQMSNASIFIIMILMFIGGSPGSTAGGIKTTTVGVLLFTVIAVLKDRDYTEMFKRRISRAVIVKAIVIVFISALVIIITVTILLLSEHNAFKEIIFESISAFGTVGISLGITPELSSVSKIMIIITMFLGRVGVLTMALALASRARKNTSNLKYKKDKVMIG